MRTALLLAFLRLCMGAMGGAASLLGCTEAPPPPPAEAPVPEAETWDAEVAISEDGRPLLRLVAPYLARFTAGDTTFLVLQPAPDGPPTPIYVELYDAEGDLAATAQARQVTYYDAERRFVAQGAVVVETPTGTTLRTETLHWAEATRRLTTDGFVRLTSATENLQGEGLVADERLESYRIARLSGQVQVQE